MFSTFDTAEFPEECNPFVKGLDEAPLAKEEEVIQTKPFESTEEDMDLISSVNEAPEEPLPLIA